MRRADPAGSKDLRSRLEERSEEYDWTFSCTEVPGRTLERAMNRTSGWMSPQYGGQERARVSSTENLQMSSDSGPDEK